MKKQIASVIKDYEFLESLQRVRYARPVAEQLNLPPVDLSAFGFSHAMPVANQHHIGIHLLDGNLGTLVEIHALGHTNFRYEPAATGFRPKHLSVFPTCPIISEQERLDSGYKAKPGPIFDLGDREERRKRFGLMHRYLAVSEQSPLPYTTPLRVITDMFRDFLDNHASLLEPALVDCRKMQWRRKYLCGGFLRLPPSAQALFLSHANGRRVDAKGYNSGSAAGDLGGILGLPLRRLYTPKTAPGIDTPILPWLKHLPVSLLPERPEYTQEARVPTLAAA